MTIGNSYDVSEKAIRLRLEVEGVMRRRPGGPIWSSRWDFTGTKTDLAYIAAFIDADGCICLTKTGVALINASNKDREVLKWMQKITGVGGVNLHGGRGMHAWNVRRTREVQDLLQAIFPYLRVKRSNAEEVLSRCKDLVFYWEERRARGIKVKVEKED